MGLVLVTADRWTPISHDWEIFIRADQLTDPGYTVRVEVMAGDYPQVRCLHPLPAGFWLRPITRTVAQDVDVVDVPGGLSAWRPYDTEQFRRAETGQFRRPDAVPPGGQQRRIWPDDYRQERP